MLPLAARDPNRGESLCCSHGISLLPGNWSKVTKENIPPTISSTPAFKSGSTEISWRDFTDYKFYWLFITMRRVCMIQSMTSRSWDFSFSIFLVPVFFVTHWHDRNVQHHWLSQQNHYNSRRHCHDYDHDYHGDNTNGLTPPTSPGDRARLQWRVDLRLGASTGWGRSPEGTWGETKKRKFKTKIYSLLIYFEAVTAPQQPRKATNPKTSPAICTYYYILHIIKDTI